MAHRNDEVVDVLGGASVVGAIDSAHELADALRAGLSFEAFEALLAQLSVSRRALAEALLMTPRTLARRRRSGRLAADESDRLFRLARVFAHAVAALGDRERAAEWFSTENRALGGATPIGLVDTDVGAREVDDALGRIEHGIFA